MRALKEWATAVDAMLDGAQTVILRKGGILDVPSGFAVSAGDEFALYPTYEHQEAAHVKDSARRYLEGALAGRGGGRGGGAGPGAVTEIGAYARVEAEADVSSDAAFEALSPMHVWSDSYVASRRRWQPERPVKAAHLRVYRLRGGLAVPDRPEYGGCRSWIDIPGAGGAAGADPVLGDGEAAARLGRFREAVAAA